MERRRIIDEEFKTAVHKPTVLAWLLHECLDEFRNASIDEIKKKIKVIIDEAGSSDGYEQYCLELYYNAEDAQNLRIFVEDTELPDNVNIVSWKAKETHNGYEVDFGTHDIRSISSIQPEDIVRQLVLSRSVIEQGDMTVLHHLNLGIELEKEKKKMYFLFKMKRMLYLIQVYFMNLVY